MNSQPPEATSTETDSQPPDENDYSIPPVKFEDMPESEGPNAKEASALALSKHVRDWEYYMMSEAQVIMDSRVEPHGEGRTNCLCDLIELLANYSHDSDSEVETQLKARCMQIANEHVALFGSPKFRKASDMIEATDHDLFDCRVAYCVGEREDSPKKLKRIAIRLLRRLVEAHKVACNEYDERHVENQAECRAKKAERQAKKARTVKRAKGLLYKELDAFQRAMRYPRNSGEGLDLVYKKKGAADDVSSVLKAYLVEYESKYKECLWKDVLFFCTPCTNRDGDTGKHTMHFEPFSPPHLSKKKEESTWAECFVSTLEILPCLVNTDSQQPKLYAAAGDAVALNHEDAEIWEIMYSLPEASSKINGWLFEFAPMKYKKDGKRLKKWCFLRAMEINNPASPLEKLCRFSKAMESKLQMAYNEGPGVDLKTRKEILGRVAKLSVKMGTTGLLLSDKTSMRKQEPGGKKVVGRNKNELQVIREDQPLLKWV